MLLELDFFLKLFYQKQKKKEMANLLHLKKLGHQIGIISQVLLES